jgi:RNA polymerase sigma-B factor
LYRLTSLDHQRPDAEESTIATIGEDDAELSGADERLAVEQLMATLPERERQIVYLRFFEGLTQAEIAGQIGISQMHVSRLLTRSLESLGEHARSVLSSPS